MTVDLVLSMKSKNCNDCTKCCEGWLTTNIAGYEVSPGKPCIFVNQSIGCNNYDNRPTDPCKTFRCEWLINPVFPAHFKPSESNIIITRQNHNNIDYLSISYAGGIINEEILPAVMEYCRTNNKNLLWQLPDNIGYIGTEDFCKAMSGDNN
jgi:hypothetical protein